MSRKLTTEEINKLAVERMTGKPQSIKGSEADEFLKELDRDIADAKKKGYVLEIPHELGEG